ncbi:MAG: fumarylacetoacetate hydrolase family protein, partial [Anaerolineales bacterium]
MHYLTFIAPGEDRPRLGALLPPDRVISLARGDLPTTMLAFIEAGPETWELAEQIANQTQSVWPLDRVKLKAPLQRPGTLRDFYAFEQHVKTANKNRGRELPEEWYHFPVFYYTNPGSIYGPNDEIPIPSYTQAMDYELEVAAVIGKPGQDINEKDALDHIFAFTILNDWSARDIQRKEMKVGLGPAKGKDFASTLGPWLVTPNELADKSTGEVGVYDLVMTARINGQEFSRGNWKDIHYSFGEMIARASESVTLYPGDVLGSGTLGT